MIIQCEQCHTKFKLDDAKVKDKGVKVRCAKCRNVFTVSRDEQLTDKPDFSAMLEQSADMASVSTPSVAFELEHEPGSASAAGFDFDTSSFAVDDKAEKPAATEPTAFELDKVESAQPSTSSTDFDLSTLAWTDEIASPADGSAAADSKIDFSGMATDGFVADADKTVVASSSFANLGDIPVQDGVDSHTKLDLDDFADSIASHGEADSFASSKDSKHDAPFNLGEIDFGADLATLPGHQVNPEKTDTDHDLLFVPLDETPEKVVDTAGFLADAAPVATETAPKVQEEPAQEELPPLPIASRRKSSSMLMIVLSAIGAAVIGLLVFFGMDMSSEEKAKPKQEAAKIQLRNVNASFVKNNTAGELLVISGEAVNNYETPRAAIQVKGIVYGATGNVLLTKNAFAGNPISKEQLATMNPEKIEAAMANQFGDSLSNMEIAPGKAIPFVVVIVKTPAEGKEFGVELIGSTGAAPKK